VQTEQRFLRGELADLHEATLLFDRERERHAAIRELSTVVIVPRFRAVGII
jgi:hypothetical protein